MRQHKPQQIIRNLKRTILENPCGNTSAMKSVPNKFVVKDNKAATTLKRSFHQGRFSANTSEFSALKNGLIYTT